MSHTFTDPATGIQFDYEIIYCCDDYVDCEIYAVMPTNEEYLLRVFSEVSNSDICGPFDSVRYSPNRTDAFEDCEHEVPQSLKDAFSKIEPHVHQLVKTEQAQKRSRHSSQVTRHNP